MEAIGMSDQEARATFSVEEAATLLGIGRGLAYDLARRGELPGVFRLGRRLLVSRTALERYLSGQMPELTAAR
jgi:excisionase family DNA binding protein